MRLRNRTGCWPNRRSDQDQKHPSHGQPTAETMCYVAVEKAGVEFEKTRLADVATPDGTGRDLVLHLIA
ncbi:MAG: hypothetical protein NXI27_27750 [Alphaproteobacteria bacterium]|nr:hypothetical protein [Alphaproteobacteria bacterium]